MALFIRNISFRCAVLIVLYLVLSACDNGGGSQNGTFSGKPWVGTKQFGTESDDFSFQVATDSNGNVYVSGYTFGDLGGNINAGSYDMYVTKFDQSGSMLWTRLLGSEVGDSFTGVAIDGLGNIYLSGYTNGSIDGNTIVGRSDAILVKYNPSGQMLWSRQFGTTDSDNTSGIAIDRLGHVYVVGWSGGILNGHVNAGGNDIILFKFDSSGNLLWDRQFGSSENDEVRGIAIDAVGNVILGGTTVGTFDGNSNAGGYDIFITKFNSNGEQKWIRQLGSTYGETIFAAATDSANNIYITGETNGDLIENNLSGSSELFLIKYDSEGTKSWGQQMGSSITQGLGMTMDAVGNVIVTGYTSGNFEGNSSAGDADIILVKFDDTGKTLWAQQFGTLYEDIAYGVAADKKGNLFVTGYTTGVFGFNHSAGSAYVFVMKYNSLGIKQ